MATINIVHLLTDLLPNLSVFEPCTRHSPRPLLSVQASLPSRCRSITMGGFRAVEDRPTPKEVYNWRLYLEASVIATGSLLFGYDSAFIGTTISRSSFKRDFSITGSTANSISSNITAAFQAGAFFGALFCFFCRSNPPLKGNARW
jgi:hypothetical protein